MIDWLVETNGGVVPLILRLTLAVGAQEGEGVEYHLLALGLALALIVSGAGAWSIDALIARS